MYRFSLERNEQILKKGTASLHVEREALSGALYLTNERLVFVGYIFGISNKQKNAIDLKEIREIKGDKTLLLIPNVLRIVLNNGTSFKFIVHGRDAWMTSIRNQMASIGKTPLIRR